MNKEQIKSIYERVLLSCYKYEHPELVFTTKPMEVYGKSVMGYCKNGLCMNFGKNVIIANPDVVCGWNEDELILGLTHELGHFLHAYWLLENKDEVSQSDVDEYEEEAGEDIANYLGFRLYDKVMGVRS